MTSNPRIFLSPPFAGPRERVRVGEAFDSGYLAPCGPQVDEFERRLAALAGVPETAAVASGTAALTLLADEFAVGPADTVFASSLTFIASVSPFVRAGAKLVFIDADAATGNLDLALLEAALTQHTRQRQRHERFFIVAVDLYGQCCNYDLLEKLAAQYEATLLIDAAEAVGAKWQNRPAGSAGAAGAYSFNGNKLITTSGGGAVLSRDPQLVKRARWRSQQSREPVAWYEHQEIGHNFRLSNLLGAFGLAQLDALELILQRKAAIREFYRQLFAPTEVTFFPREEGTQANNWLTVVLYPSETERNRVAAALAQDNIEARPVWKPMHLQPVFAQVERYDSKVAEQLFRRGLCLPSGAGLGTADLERIAAALSN